MQIKADGQKRAIYTLTTSDIEVRQPLSMAEVAVQSHLRGGATRKQKCINKGGEYGWHTKSACANNANNSNDNCCCEVYYEDNGTPHFLHCADISTGDWD